MKKISICIPVYNEVGNVENAYRTIKKILDENLQNYDYEFVVEDNASTDGTQEILRKIANEDYKFKVVINQRNFGIERSGRNLITCASGDVLFSISCDCQEPPEMLPEMIKYWEEGYLVVWGQKISSEEGFFKFQMRKLYYKIISFFSETKQYQNVVGFGLIDAKVIKEVISLQEQKMSMRHIIAELGYEVKLLPYKQRVRKAGKSSYNFWRYWLFAVTSLARTSVTPLHLASFIGIICSLVSFIIGMFYMVYKLIFWKTFSTGVAPLVIGMFFLGSVQLTFIGIIGEYVGIIYEKVVKRPLVIEKERINFDED